MNFSVELRGDSLLLSWKEPFVMNGLAPPTYVINTTAFNGSIILHETNETTSLQISKATVDNSSCTVYTLCVQANTAAGLGETACANKSRIGGTKSYVHVLFLLQSHNW